MAYLVSRYELLKMVKLWKMEDGPVSEAMIERREGGFGATPYTCQDERSWNCWYDVLKASDDGTTFATHVVSAW
jgi:hypothetical protein